MAANRQTYIHTTSANAVTLVWGSLRLAPIKLVSCSLFLCYTVQAAGLKSTIVRLDKIFAVQC